VTSQLLAAAASVALVGAGIAGTSGVRSFEAMPTQTTVVADGEGAGGQCRVDVVRTGDSGTVNTTKSVLEDNSCVCTVTTGPVGANGNAEGVVTGILRDRTCADSPTVGKTVSEAATSGGGSGVIIPVVVGVVGAAGLAVALGSNSRG
jgi:hypothetical protein